MTRKIWFLPTLVAGIAVAIACGNHSAAPNTPSATTAASSNASSDGSTLKATAPTLQSPIKGVKLDAGTTLTLVKHRANLGRLLSGTENRLEDKPMLHTLTRAIHVMSLGLWFGAMVMFNFIVAPTTFATL